MVEFESVSFGYQGRPVLDSVDLALDRSGFWFLTGRSGAGKTTVLRLINREIAPTAGRIRLFGEDDTEGGAKDRRRIGFVHQEPRFIDHLSLRDNVALPHLVDGESSAASGAEVDALIAWTGLRDRADALPPTLSGGEKQRAALARALLRAPDLILADEPTGNLDWDMSLKMLDLFAELNRSGVTLVVATHDLPLIREAKGLVAARTLRIEGGRVQQAGADL